MEHGVKRTQRDYSLSFNTRKLRYLLRCQPDKRVQAGRDRLLEVLGERRLLVQPKRQHRAFIASIVIPTYSSQARIRLPHQGQSTRGWRTLPNCRRKAARCT